MVWANLLVLNIDKTKFVLLHNEKDVAINWKLKIGRNRKQEIERKKTINFLGELMDECSQWKGHVDFVPSKIIKIAQFVA